MRSVKANSERAWAPDPFDDPIFVIGNVRSGSTLFFELLSYHRALGWLTHYENYIPQFYCGGVLRRVLERKHWHVVGRNSPYAPKPLFNWVVPRRSEGYAFWSRITGQDFHRSWLWSARADQEQVLTVQRAVGRILRWQGKSCFATKFTGPGRIGYLKSIFPRSKFVHLVRNPEAQVRSVLKVDFWKRGGGYERLWWPADPPPGLMRFLESAEATADPVALAAAQWRAVILGIRTEARSFCGPGHYWEVSYERFVRDPLTVVNGLWVDLGLETDTEALARVRSYPITPNRDKTLSGELSSAERKTISRWTAAPATAEVGICLAARGEGSKSTLS